MNAPKAFMNADAGPDPTISRQVKCLLEHAKLPTGTTEGAVRYDRYSAAQVEVPPKSRCCVYHLI